MSLLMMQIVQAAKLNKVELGALNELIACKGSVEQHMLDGFTYIGVKVGPLSMRMSANSLKHS